MTVELLSYGSVLVALGPSTALYFQYVFTRPVLFCLSLVAAFSFVLAFLASGILRAAFFPLARSFWWLLLVTIGCQEVARGGMLVAYGEFERKFSVLGTNAVLFPLRDLSSALAAGLGWGLADIIMVHGDVLVRTTGAATLVSPACSQVSVPVAASIAATGIWLLDVALMVIALDAFRRRSLARAVAVVALHATHFGVGAMNTSNGGCVGYLVSQAVVAMASVLLAFALVNKDGYRSKRFSQD